MTRNSATCFLHFQKHVVYISDHDVILSSFYYEALFIMFFLLFLFL